MVENKAYVWFSRRLGDIILKLEENKDQVKAIYRAWPRYEKECIVHLSLSSAYSLREYSLLTYAGYVIISPTCNLLKLWYTR
jgi:hypothetical protein